MWKTVLALLLGCTGKNTGESTRPGFEPVLTPNPLLVNEVALDVTLDETDPVKVRCEGPTEGDWPETHVFTSSVDTGSSDQGANHHVVMDGLLADTAYACTMEGSAGTLGDIALQTEPLPDAVTFADLSVTTSEEGGFAAGWTLINPTDWASSAPDAGGDIVVDPLGRVRWYKDTAGYDGIAAFEFDTSLENFYAGGGYLDPPPFQVWDRSANEVLSWEGVGANHDVERHGDDWFFLTHEGGQGTHCVESRDSAGSVLDTWCIEEDPLVGTGGANSIAVRDEGGRTYVYVTIKNAGIIYKLDWDAKEVVWHLMQGGDLDYDADYAITVHDIHVADCEGFDECLLFYDNGTEHSSIRQVGIDEHAMRASLLREWTEPGWQEPNLGGIEPVGENWLVGVGHTLGIGPGKERYSQVIEVSPVGDVVWRLEIQPDTISIYRARRIAACDLFHDSGLCPSLEAEALAN